MRLLPLISQGHSSHKGVISFVAAGGSGGGRCHPGGLRQLDLFDRPVGESLFTGPGRLHRFLGRGHQLLRQSQQDDREFSAAARLLSDRICLAGHLHAGRCVAAMFELRHVHRSLARHVCSDVSYVMVGSIFISCSREDRLRPRAGQRVDSTPKELWAAT